MKTNSGFKKIIFLTCIALVLVTPVVTFAQTVTNTANACSSANGNADLGTCIGQIYIWSLGLAALLAFCMIIIGGYRVLTARGNADSAQKGRSYITSSLLGLLLLFGAYILLHTINPDLTQFHFDASSFKSPGSATQTTTPPR